MINDTNRQLYRTITVIFLYGIGIGSLILLFFFPESASRLGVEDGPAENATALLFAISSVLLIVHGIRTYRLRPDNRLLAVAALLSGVLFFVFAGEEISWGQRIFGIETNEFMLQYNWQNEINLHNLHTDIFNIVFHYGAFALLIVLPLFKSQILAAYAKTRLPNIIEPFIAPLWLTVPSFILLGLLDSRFIFMIEKPWAATVYLIGLAAGSALLLWQLLSYMRKGDNQWAILTTLSLTLILGGLIVSYVYAVDQQATNIISEYKELFIAACLLAYAVFWNSEEATD